MKRFFDLLMCVILVLPFVVLILIIAIAIYMSSSGPILYWSDRVGKNNYIFRMPKFRSMKINTPAIPTHLMLDAEDYLTPIGAFLRKFSLDELPQLFSIIKGDMTFVGPRPALFNQEDLIELRTKYGIDQLMPGVTGWAQINGRDNISIIEKVELDKEYFDRQSFWFDLKILWITLLKVIKRDSISH